MKNIVKMSPSVRPKRGVEDRETGSREALILAAITLFAERGYDGTRTRDIVHATGLNISLISYYFGGKEGLLKACLEYIQTKIQDEASAYLEDAVHAQDFAARLRGFIASFLASHTRNPHMHRVVQRELERDSAIFKQMVDKSYIQWYQKLSAFIADGQKKKWVYSNIDPMTISIALYGSMVQEVRLDRFRRDLQGISLNDPVYFERIVNDLVMLFSRGLLVM